MKPHTTKRPVAEFIEEHLAPEHERDHATVLREMWGILRRKQGYIVHRIYQHAEEPLIWLVYAEWESRQAANGARQRLQETPLFRRARSTITGTSIRSFLELSGAVTSTKGLDLDQGAVAVLDHARRTALDTGWRDIEQAFWKQAEAQTGYLAHVTFRGIDDERTVGALSHWISDSAYEAANQQLASTAQGRAFIAALSDVRRTRYKVLRI